MKHMLIVDDSAEDRAYLIRLLSGMPHIDWQFSEAETAGRALALLDQERFDCVFLDNQLPDATGIAMLERLRTAAGDLVVPVVILTGLGDETLAANAIKAGAMDYLPKGGLTRLLVSRASLNAMEKFELIQQRKLSEDALHRSRQRLQTMAEAAPGILFTHGADGSYSYLSGRFYEYTGMLESSAEYLNWKTPLHPEDLQHGLLGGLDSIARGEPYEAEYRLRRHDGVYRWFAARVVPIRENGAITEWAGVSIDIHDAKETRNELELQKRALERSNEELQRFAGVIAHDLQSPLRTVGTMTQLLMRRYKGALDEETLELTKFVESGVRRMSRLIADLLLYSQVAGQDRSSFVPLDAADSVNWAIQNLQAEILESKTSIIIEDPLPMVAADDQLGRVFQNVIGNAIKYRVEKPPEIRISAEQVDQQWVFAVSDNGIGFEMKDSERIFGAFQRLHNASQYEGTGIGLATSKRIIEQYGGRMWVQSAPAEGSTFYFSVPT